MHYSTRIDFTQINGFKAIRHLEQTTDIGPRTEANLDLLHLSQDFIYAATSYGKIIISEYYLPYDSKTIKPKELGGILGGEKYIVHNILFKFAVGMIYIYHLFLNRKTHINKIPTVCSEESMQPQKWQEMN